MMSGWPRGAVDSLRCSADVLTGFRPFAHSLAPPLRSLQRGRGWRGGAGETGEAGGGDETRGERETGKECGKMDGGEKRHRKSQKKGRPEMDATLSLNRVRSKKGR